MGIILGIILGIITFGLGTWGGYLLYTNNNSSKNEKSILTKQKAICEQQIKDEEDNLNHWQESRRKLANEKIEQNTAQILKIENKIKQIESPSNKKAFLLFVLSGIMCIAFIFVPFSFHQINTGEVAVVKVWGKAEYTKTEGTHFDFWIGKKYQKYDIKVRQTECSTMAYSQDAQTMDVKLTVQYRIQVENVMKINKEFGSLEVLESRLQSIVEDKTKATMSLLQAMKIIEQREMISAEVIKNISEESNKYYVEIVNVLITNIDFSDAFEKAVEDKMIAEQDKLKANYEKEKAIIQAEQELEVAKKQAEAQLEKARKEAEATEVRAEAEANALQIIQEAWDSISEEVRAVMLHEMAIESWNGELPDTMVGSDFFEWLMGAIN